MEKIATRIRRLRAGGDGAKGVGYLVRGDLEVTDGRHTKQTSERASSQECDLRVEARKSGQRLVLCDGSARTAELLGLNLTFRHRASCILGQAFRYSPENAFYIFNQQIYFII